jgi:hypothetical protein
MKLQEIHEEMILCWHYYESFIFWPTIGIRVLKLSKYKRFKTWDVDSHL